MVKVSADWNVGGQSVRGAKHFVDGRPNQDAIALAGEPVAVVAIADGHGSPRCVRSDVGSALAVNVAVETLPEFVATELEDELLRERLADRIVGAWVQRVRAHLAAYPFVPAERRAALDDPLLAYGSTLIAMAVHEGELLALQIGDGDLLMRKETTERVFARDPRFAMNETTSLCLPEARTEVRVARLLAPPGTLVIAATDGYANSFVLDRDFIQIADDYAAMIRQDGFAAALGELATILTDTTRSGSGDDITVGMLYRQTFSPSS